MAGSRRDAEQAAQEAISVLETLPPSPGLAMAYSNKSQLLMLAFHDEQAETWANKAIALARELGDHASLAHALNNLGSAMCHRLGFEAGRRFLEESLAVALAAELEEDVARAFSNLTWMAIYDFEYEAAARYVNEGLVYVEARELEGFQSYQMATRSVVRFEIGAWNESENDARWVLSRPESAGISPVPALATLGSIQVRRGQPEAEVTLRQAWELAVESGELQRTGPVAFGLAEHAWLHDDLPKAREAIETVYEGMLELGSPRNIGEAAFWMWRSGAISVPPARAARPYALQIDGDWRGAAEEWGRLGRRYERASALADGDDEGALLEALTVFDDMGAVPAASKVRRKLRSMGTAGVPRRARPETRANPARLTLRQLEVLGLLTEGLKNVEIADRLFVSTKTVDHHVSAVLLKLGVTSRTEVRRAADRLGVKVS